MQTHTHTHAHARTGRHKLWNLGKPLHIGSSFGLKTRLGEAREFLPVQHVAVVLFGAGCHVPTLHDTTAARGLEDRCQSDASEQTNCLRLGRKSPLFGRVCVCVCGRLASEWVCAFRSLSLSLKPKTHPRSPLCPCRFVSISTHWSVFCWLDSHQVGPGIPVWQHRLVE